MRLVLLSAVSFLKKDFFEVHPFTQSTSIPDRQFSFTPFSLESLNSDSIWPPGSIALKAPRPTPLWMEEDMPAVAGDVSIGASVGTVCNFLGVHMVDPLLRDGGRRGDCLHSAPHPAAFDKKFTLIVMSGPRGHCTALTGQKVI